MPVKLVPGAQRRRVARASAPWPPAWLREKPAPAHPARRGAAGAAALSWEIDLASIERRLMNDGMTL